MKKKILAAMFAAMIAATSLGAPESAYAAGEATVEDEANASSPTTVINNSNGNIGTTQGIDVTSTEVGNMHEIVYNVAISWGDMQFKYYYGPTWDPESHTYKDVDGVGQQGWQTSYLNGTNNKITVTNNSNYPVTVDMTFSLASGRFNNGSSSKTRVQGVFNTDLDMLRTNINDALNDTFDITDCGSTSEKFNLASADKENTYFTDKQIEESEDENLKNNTNALDVYFGLWGIPDKDKAQNDGAKAGTINVKVTPYSKN